MSSGTKPRQKPALRLVTKAKVGVGIPPDITTNNVVETVGTSRASLITGGGNTNQRVEDNIVVKNRKMSITINGVDISEIQKSGRHKDNDREDMKKKKLQKTPGRKRKPEPPSDQAGQMNRYVVRTSADDNKLISDRNHDQVQVLRKQDDIKTTVSDRNGDNTLIDRKNDLREDNNTVKTTFSSVQSKIKKFQQFSSDANECVLGSGRCAYHNCKLTRVLSLKKMSVIDECGKVSWDRREVTSLACPKASQAKPMAISESVVSSKVESRGSNKKSRIFGGKTPDQSADRSSVTRENEDAPLDNTDKLG